MGAVMIGSPLLAVNLDPFLTYWPVLGVGCAVGLIVLTVLSVRRFRAPERTLPSPAPYDGPEEGLLDSDWHLDPMAYSDRRGTVRREGRPVRVLVTSPTLKSEVASGYVLDRSTGGLRLALTVAVASGITLRVRADNAPDNTPWVTVLVRNCRNAGQHYELGCEFDKTPPWNVLLLFG
jgi:hypothetical protein